MIVIEAFPIMYELIEMLQQKLIQLLQLIIRQTLKELVHMILQARRQLHIDDKLFHDMLLDQLRCFPLLLLISRSGSGQPAQNLRDPFTLSGIQSSLIAHRMDLILQILILGRHLRISIRFIHRDDQIWKPCIQKIHLLRHLLPYEVIVDTGNVTKP